MAVAGGAMISEIPPLQHRAAYDINSCVVNLLLNFVYFSVPALEAFITYNKEN